MWERERERKTQRERKDRRTNLPGLLLVRQIFSRWGGSAGEGKARLGGWGGSRGSANTFRKQKYITVHVSRKMSRELTGRAEGRGRSSERERVRDMQENPFHVTSSEKRNKRKSLTSNI